jgi:thioredoxin reductase (NADPH)
MVVTETDIGEIVMRAFILRRVGLIRHAQGGVVVVGPGHGGDTLRIQRFLGRNGYPHRLFDTEVEADSAAFLKGFSVLPEELPVVVLGQGEVLRRPGNAELADALGLTEDLTGAEVFDLAVVGAGPAGLASAVYGASEGLRTVVVEAMAPGGQAGTSSRIENYLGFPTGISGQALAGRAFLQAQKFGAKLAVSRAVEGLDCAASPFVLHMEGGGRLRSRAVVIATGARYRKLDVPGYERFEGGGIHYAATAVEAKLCVREEVIVVGGGNSAGQAAVFLSGHAAHVHLLVRSSGLAATMSDYLIQRIQNSPRITLRPFTEITALTGTSGLSEVTWRNRKTEEEETRRIGNVFVMIGAEPNTDWLHGCVELDPRGFVRTGVDEEGRALASPFATTVPGVYAVGDVRAGSVKRVASGVGEGSVVVQAVHAFLNPGAG